MVSSFDVCIRGAGIVGRTLALLLARERLRVALVGEPAAASPRPDVRAYALNTASQGLLQSLRCWPEPAEATPVLGMEVFGDEGGAVRFEAAAQQAPALAWIVDVPALEARLADAVRYQPQVEWVESPVNAALTVVCEGRASSTRDAMAVRYDSSPYHQQALALRLQCERPHGQVARQWMGQGGILAFLPLDGPQGNSVAVVWSVPESEAPALLALAPEDLARRLEEASHGALGSLRLQSECAAWPLQLAKADRWVGRFAKAAGTSARGWALAGDAAHTVHPLAGQGLNLGLADAAGLTQVLREREYWRGLGDERLLRRYERARKAALAAMATATDGLQQLFARDDAAARSLRNWGMKGFEHSGPLKQWVARQAMGL